MIFVFQIPHATLKPESKYILYTVYRARFFVPFRFRHLSLKLLHLNLQSNFGVDVPVANILSYLITNDNSCIVDQELWWFKAGQSLC